MAKNVAYTMVGVVKKNRSEKAWAQAYRGLQHGDADKACKALRGLAFPPDLKDCADAFIDLQLMRHDADYDPLYRLTRTEAVFAVQKAEDAVKKLRSAEPKDRRAFAVQVLVKRR